MQLAMALSVSIDYLLGENKEDELHSILHNDKIKALFSDFKELSADDKNTILKQVEWLKARRKKI